jgi:hypothetical protein
VGGKVEHSAVVVTTVLGAIGAAATVCFGLWLALRRAWKALPLAALAGALVLMTWYGVAFLVLQPDDGITDNAAGAGSVMISVPAFVVVAVLLVIGASPIALGRGIRRMRGV